MQSNAYKSKKYVSILQKKLSYPNLQTKIAFGGKELFVKKKKTCGIFLKVRAFVYV